MTNANDNLSLFPPPELNAPLAARLRPTCLEDVVGQQHLIADGKPLAEILRQDASTSIILWGPPGTGKTTLAELIAQHSNANFIRISAVTDGVKEIRGAIEKATHALEQHQRTVVFVDEVHRFNKSQQDAFLPHIESGLIQFIGATTENPSFSLNNALLSRTRLFVLKSLSTEDLEALIIKATKAINHSREKPLTVTPQAIKSLLNVSSGDGRKLLTQFELAVQLCDGDTVELAHVTMAQGETSTAFDRGGDYFYDHLSAFHKSVRGSSVDGALFYFARLIQAGCEATVVARRLLAIASEDIGNADPKALQVCLNAWDIYHRVGASEGERAIAQAIVYCALAPKSNAVYAAFKAAKQAAQKHPDAPIPNHLRNAPTAVARSQGHGEGYRYAHNEPNAYAAGEVYLPENVDGGFYYPTERGFEKQLKAKQDFLDSLDLHFHQNNGNHAE
ncbi:replication-associated recombination protein A [Alteromonas facilis]|uniref:replication-associated recombination protein A n=1 Tax=Alteromonas facilis TaxID=2048004 RepID=UPI000C28260B|nr:replication-associated recombination protein A [Alteromonas facilis]